ncbi:MAG: hypothetical protein ACRELC_06185 [Gemmatimonadota bacterium]
MSSWVIAGERPSRVEPEVAFLVTFFVGVVLFLVGIFPGFVFEMDRRMDASRRCPPIDGSLEPGHDPGCVAAIVARGPLYLGRGPLVASFLLGSIAVVCWTRVSRSRRPRAMTAAIAVLYLLGWRSLLAWNAAEGERLVSDGLDLVT